MSVNTYSLKRDGELKLSTNFKVKEYASHDGSDKVLIDSDLVKINQAVRDHFGKDAIVTITSGYRSPEHNKKVGGASSSYHVRGQASDIIVKGVEPPEVAKFLESIGVKGIGLYMYSGGHFVHCDTRTTKYYWKQTSSSGYYSVSGFGGSNINTSTKYKVNAKNGLKLRTSASSNTSANIICVMGYGAIVTMISYGTAWCKISYTNANGNTKTGYCSTKYLAKC